MFKRRLFFIVLLATGYLNAQTFYWVGGSGYWNDINHWSFVSGGAPATTIPNSSSTVVFDNASSISSFTIHALHDVSFHSIIAQNTQFKIDVIGSPTVDLRISGQVTLNPNFQFNLNGKIYLSPQNSVNYQFSHQKFHNDIVLNASSDVDLGVLSTSKSILISGNFKLKNSVVFADDIQISNARLVFDNNLFQATTRVDVNNSQITNPTATKSKIICPLNNLQPSVLQTLHSVSNLSVNPIMPQACVVPNPTVVFPTCQGLCNGVAIFNLSGCTNPPYLIQWINPVCSSSLPPAQPAFSGTTYSVNTLCGCSSQYLVIFENALGEQAAVSVGVVDPPATILNFSQTQPTCNNLCNGQIRASVLTGAVPMVINWNPPNVSHTNIISKDTLKNACAGTYTITATNVNGCTNTFTTVLVQPSVLLANGSSSSVTCNASCDGSALVAPSGGTGPYSYSWSSPSSSPSTSTLSNFGGLCPGVVTATVTDTKSCSATYSANITQPPAITLTVTKTNLICANICNGTASVTATGGIGSYTYSWTPSGGTGASATGLCSGNYTVTVTNNVTCIKTITVDILSPPTLTASPTQSNILCNAACNGSVNLNPTGGTSSYTYSWSPVVSNTVTASGLCAGIYSYSVTDVLGCQYTNTVSITQPPASTLSISSASITCNAACNGSAIGNMSGGTSPYTYSWSPGNPLGQTTPTITNLCPNTYTLKVTDVNGCMVTKTVTISQPTPITANITTVTPSCNGTCDGSINTIPSGGVAPYSYTLQTSSTSITSNPPFTNLCAGSYSVIIKDALGCVKIQTVSLTQPNPITLTLNATSINCFNQCNASVSAVVNGGSPIYTFTWSTGGTSNSLVNQCAGVRSATVTDVNGCSASATVTITSKPDLTISITPTNPNCNSQCTGILTTSVSGGTPNYTINWNNGAVGNIVNNLCQGVYTVTVTDFLGCIKTQTASIITPPAITLTPANGTVSCSGVCDGTISVTASGGTPGYFYNWNTIPVQTSQLASGLCAGNYFVTVTDSKGCIASVGANVIQPAVLTASMSNVQASCNVCIGSATANGIGGTPPYTYLWVPGGQTTQTASNLCVGPQTITITDSKGCLTTQTVQINQLVIVLVTSNGNTLACNGACSGVAIANASGGIAPYSYTWTPVPTQNTQIASGLCAGTHTVMVSDVNGCSNMGTVNFVNPPAITLTVNKTDVTCNGSCNGSASAIANGGTGVLSYLWQPGGMTTSSVSGLCPGSYSVTVSDINNCSQVQVITITQSNSITATFTFTNPTSCVTANGAIATSITGGLAPYTYTWLPGNSSANPYTNLSAGNYSLNINDAAGCTRTVVASLSSPTGATVSVVSNSISCFGLCSGSATLSISGVGPFSVNGSAIPSNTTTLLGLCSGITNAVVLDANGCVTNQTISISQPPQHTATGIITNATCHSVCSGSINLTPNGGTPAYTYSWFPTGGNVQDPINLCSGNYSVITTDANGCSLTNTFVIVQPTSLTLSFNKKDVLCHGNCDGGVRAIVGGGTTPYSYTWTPLGSFLGSTIDTLVNLCSGIYSVTVQDLNGCSISGTVNIGQPTLLTSTLTSINAKCNNQCNGSAIINVSGGTLPYSFSYNTSPAVTTQTINNLCDGSYIGQVIDANGCSNTLNFNITEPLPIVITSTLSHPKCHAVCDGSVATTVTGGNPSYHYSWITSGGTVPNPTGLCAGNYTVVVTDDSLCSAQALVVLIDPVALIANTTFTNPTCNLACNGIVSASPIGGTAPYSYSWISPSNNNQTVSNLCSGAYTVTVSDANSCQSIQSVTLTDPSAITLNPAVTPATCGSSNGSINAVASSGVAPYTYQWLPPVSAAQSTNTLVTSIPAGIYTVIVTDASACSATLTIPLSNSNGPNGATITSTNVACNGQCNGAADVSNPIGGAAPYVLSWVTPVSLSPSISGLCAGTYTAQIQDANNCIFYKAVTILQPQLIDDNETILSATCFGNCNGSITLNPSGGNGTYSYVWSNGSNLQTVSGLCPGSISVIITDNLNCNFAATYTVPSLTTITSSTFATNNNCFGDCNGTLLATNVAGGLPPYSFNWSDSFGQSTSLAVGLCNGSYSVTITDANGCFNSVPAIISSPSQVAITQVSTQPICYNDCNGSFTVTPIGGTMPYTYTWTPTNVNNNSITNLCSGSYSILVNDANGCSATDTYSLTNPPLLTLSAIITSASCNTTLDGAIDVTVSGGVPNYSYTWTPTGAITQDISNVLSGVHSLTLTDNYGCNLDTSFVLTPAITVNAVAGQDTMLCQNITLLLDGSASNGGVSYQWFEIPGTSAIANSITTSVTPAVGTNTYVLLATNGACNDQDTILVTTHALPIVDAGPMVNIPIFSSSSIGGNPTAASGSIFSWFPITGLNNPNSANPVSGTTVTTIYTVSVVDVNGCIGSDTVTVYIYPEITIPNGFSPNGDGKNDVWQIDFINLFPDCEVEVYNRWGEQLFYSVGYSVPFNGQYKGKDLPVGTYYYVIKLNHPAYPNAYTSPLTIFR